MIDHGRSELMRAIDEAYDSGFARGVASRDDKLLVLKIELAAAKERVDLYLRLLESGR